MREQEQHARARTALGNVRVVGLVSPTDVMHRMARADLRDPRRHEQI